jgi:hypothetical protein
MLREVYVGETEWWDRIAAAVEALERRAGVRRRFVRVGERAIEIVDDGQVLIPTGTEAERPGGRAVTAYVFPRLKDTEILRRLTQLPDETPMDNLLRPFAVYCPEMESFVSVNDLETSLEQHLKKLFGSGIPDA